MKYIKDTLDFKIEEPSVITLGKFDGLHTGHRYLMDAMQKGKEQMCIRDRNVRTVKPGIA